MNPIQLDAFDLLAAPIAEPPAQPLDDPPSRTLVLMPCSATKGTREAALIDLYRGPLWQTLRQHRGDVPRHNVCVLSARYGFRCATMYGDPYEERLSAAKADYLIRGGVLRHNDLFGKIRKGMTAMHPLAEVSRGSTFTVVINAGAGHYARVFDAFITGFVQYRVVEADARVLRVKGGIGKQRQQLGQWLRELNGKS